MTSEGVELGIVGLEGGFHCLLCVSEQKAEFFFNNDILNLL